LQVPVAHPQPPAPCPTGDAGVVASGRGTRPLSLWGRPDPGLERTMLSERDSQLLTAYLDGELSAASAKPSCACCTGRRRPASCSNSSRRHPRPAPAAGPQAPAEFPPSNSLRTIAERGLQPGRPARRHPRRIPAWAGVVAAAAVLIAVVAGGVRLPRRRPATRRGPRLLDRPGFKLPDLPPPPNRSSPGGRRVAGELRQGARGSASPWPT